jgi:16S rRNA (cytidine1402-2'-O)-methyltransferase
VAVECAGHRDGFTAIATPFFLGGDSLVFRRGPELRGRTFAYNASKSAAEVDRELIEALRDRAGELHVTITPLSSRSAGGALFVVALPIGNDDDLTPRARQVLEAADLVLAEDTRRLRDLVRRTGLDLPDAARIESCHEHNEDERAETALVALGDGARVALVSDAGTPLCSDPGYTVVRRAVDAGFAVSPVPGPSSLLAVLSVAGLPVDRFSYVGFLPRRAAARRAELRAISDTATTFVCHEAPHRMRALVDDLAEVCPDWQVCVGREVTKVFEEFRRGTARDLARELADDEPRGEYTLVVAPPAGPAPHGASDAIDDRLVRALLDEGVTPRSIASALATLPGVSRKEAYARVLVVAERA